MRSALTLLALVSALLATGCRSHQADCDGCTPNTQCCRKWQPSVCNNWNWYEPAPMIEEGGCDGCLTYSNVSPGAAPCQLATPCK